VKLCPTHWCNRATWPSSESHKRLLSGCLHLLTSRKIQLCIMYGQRQNILFSVS